ncbi:transglutaminase-like domain-containing protein [Aurantiacibacter poecillastricola]|uniref:transglutaminase-like domain-containing protein n=1 Tax=Aurantiacibacter poecillastricola TaxID=3064385 RepID=UPI00273F8004|nr:transglutaminase family protein [Aurantiacibacter sp. 219JJ12-13]MDP5261223.1 transglutaminase family protein [Aurantiacibacter sp. 219JJ12-13]
MPIDISAKFAFHLDEPTDLLLQFEAAKIPEQTILSCNTNLAPAMHTARVPAHDNIGERIWVRAEGDYHVEYTAKAKVERLVPDLTKLHRMDPHDLPGEAVEYLFDSRYCQAARMQSFISDRFGHLEGGEQITAMCDWMANNFHYESGTSNAETTALDTFVERRGICRDYAHVMICFARASTIPARYVSCYAPGVEPPDFHAVAEVFLNDPTTPGGGAWYIVDGTGMADATRTAKIGIGRDAADVSFLTTFGMSRFDNCEVSVQDSGTAE